MAPSATVERTAAMDTDTTFTCRVCRSGTRKPGTTTITVTRDDGVLVFRHVPAQVCDNCEDAVLDAKTAQVLERQQALVRSVGATTAICEFVPAA